MEIDADAWIERLAAELGVPAPTVAERDAILELAGIAAHASERRAAPVACWLAASRGMSAVEALEVARRLAPPPVDVP